MTSRLLIICLLLFMAMARGAAQCPPNIGFEAGDFSSWQASAGTVEIGAGIQLYSGGPVNGRHTIISASNPGIDPYGRFPRLCPNGGGVSVRLGNSSTRAQAEGLSYTFRVPDNQDTFTITYFYAVVFQNPDHSLSEQPRFQVTATDLTSRTEVPCSSFDFVAAGNIPGFRQSVRDTMVFYKDWTPASLQFTGRSGHTIRLDFKTADCTRGGHFGYAYVDVADQCSNVAASAPFCPEANALVLNAPFGFESYTWFSSDFTQTIGTGQTLTLSPPPFTSGYFWVDMIPYPGYGCRDTIKAIVTQQPVPDTPRGPRHQFVCTGSPPSPITAVPDPGAVLIWYASETATDGQPAAPYPDISTTGTDTIWVSQKILFGCESRRRMVIVHVVLPPVIGVRWDDSCARRPVLFQASASEPIASWEWDIAGTPLDGNGPAQVHVFPGAGAYWLNLTATAPNGCEIFYSAPVRIADIRPIRYFDTLAAIGQEVLIDGGGPPGTRYQWTPATGLLSDTAAVALALAEHSQPYSLYAVTREGCEARSQVLVRRMLGPEIYVPSAFTPNRDGRNDLLRAIPVGIRSFSYFSVYDRNGHRLFHTTDYRAGWDGRNQGLEMTSATLVYVAEAIDYRGNRLFRKGTVTLIR
ncbi:MAG: T9SS type B sorting domain-containing protein [Chitinophagaceae bacterium]|nr:MAG: T9SS type B sorting domain-containing protein [Chitinophagaceae bacterium]